MHTRSHGNQSITIAPLFALHINRELHINSRYIDYSTALTRFQYTHLGKFPHGFKNHAMLHYRMCRVTPVRTCT